MFAWEGKSSASGVKLVTSMNSFEPFIYTAAFSPNGNTVGTRGYQCVMFVYKGFSIHQHRENLWCTLISIKN